MCSSNIYFLFGFFQKFAHVNIDYCCISSLELRGSPKNISGNMFWFVPRIVNNLFTGRTEIIAKIMNAISNSRGMTQQHRFIIGGMGGQGKSEICLQIANKLRHEYVKTYSVEVDQDRANLSSFWGVFWLEVSSLSVAKSSFTSVARLLRSSTDTIDDVLQLMSNFKTSWLLILDNADDLDVDYQGYFPSGGRGTIIMTSRVANCIRYETIGSETLTGLNQNECVELLLKTAEIPMAAWHSYSKVAGDVVSDLSFHTLSIIQPGAYIARGHSSIKCFPYKLRE